MSNLAEVIMLVEHHHKENPKHGIDCACMDWQIQQARKLFKAADPECHRRVDYVLRKALER